VDESLSEECGESELTTEGIIKTPDLTVNITWRKLDGRGRRFDGNNEESLRQFLNVSQKAHEKWEGPRLIWL
jgi:hypothetical protein